ncbi:hypothetical protein CAPTEDRAFT_218774, partial [Capitella teleta]
MAFRGVICVTHVHVNVKTLVVGDQRYTGWGKGEARRAPMPMTVLKALQFTQTKKNRHPRNRSKQYNIPNLVHQVLNQNDLQQDKSSAEICRELDLTDVELEYTDADYQNLTTYKFFVRMVRPQLTAVNHGLATSKLNQVLEAKWQEFQDSNPYNQSQEEILGDSSGDEAMDDNDDSKAQSAEEEGSDDDKEIELSDESPLSSRPSSRARKSTFISDDEDSSRSSKKKSKEKRSSLKIKMPMFGLRKSARDRSKTKKSYAISDDEQLQDDEDEDEYGGGSTADSEEYGQRKKSKRKQSKRQPPKKKHVESDESQSSEDPSDSDASYERRSSRKRKKKLKPEKPVIPGERKSSRKSLGGGASTSKHQAEETVANLSEMTDREFEKMLRLEEKEKQRVKAEKANRRKEKEIEKKREERKKRKAEAKKNKKGYWQDAQKAEMKEIPERKEGGGSGNESDHFWYCEVCKDGGDLMLCDTCPKSFHQSCINLNEIPDGDWSCPICTGEGLPEDGDSSNSAQEEEEGEEETEHDQFCKVCKRGGDVILCDFCSCVFHLRCLNPPLGEVPEGDWKCPRCKISEKSPKGKVVRVLTWRWDQQLKGTDETDHTQSPEKQAQIKKSLEESKQKNERKPERELFVKFEYHSYWDCEWIPELTLEVFQVVSWQSFRKQFDQNEPPALEDGSSFGKIRKKSKASQEEDPHNLEERYFRYGIKPEWLQIERILCHEGKNKDLRYLVKWRGLPHTESTWEYPSDLPEGLLDWDKHVDNYQRRRKERLKLEEVKTKKKEMPKKSKWRKQLEVQPEYIEVTGCKLHPYQLEGLNWIRFSYAQDTNTILADEMGLGKTIQSISFLYSLYKEGYCRDYPFIVAAPLSTVPNWEREFEMWAPDLYVVTYIGSRDNRSIIREREFSYRDGAFHNYTKPGRMRSGFRPKFDVLLTSYEMLNIDKTTLSSLEWGCIVIDEAHRLKNQQSLFFRSLSEYKLHYKLLLTGTPLQNNLEELFSLLNFLEPGKFDNMENFLNNFSEISRDEQVSKLHEMLAPHMLRRLKMDVLKDIPAKSEFIIRVELSNMQ